MQWEESWAKDPNEMGGQGSYDSSYAIPVPPPYVSHKELHFFGGVRGEDCGVTFVHKWFILFSVL